MRIFAERLKELRLKKKEENPNYTQEYVAEKIGVARTTYTAYENGTKTPPPETLKIIADFFHVSSDYLLGLTDIPMPEQTPNLKTWLRQTNPDLSERELNLLEDDIQDYLEVRMKRIAEKRNREQ